MAALLKVDNISTASNTGTANLTLNSDGSVSVPNTLAMGSSFKRNRIINGNMGVWQRGTSFSLASGSYVYTTDRFFAKYASVGTASQSTDVPTTTGSSFQYSLKLQRNSGQTSTSGNYLTQIIESINCYDLSNQTVTLSFWAKKGADYSGSGNNLSVALQTGTAADQGQVAWWNGFTGNATPINTSVTLTSSWQKFSVTGTCGAGILEAAPFWVYSGQGTAGADDSFYITGVQLEVGSIATPYERQIYSEQLAQCQRYYYRMKAEGIASTFCTGFNDSTTVAAGATFFPVQMRAAPSALEQSGTASDYRIRYQGGVNTVCSSVPTISASTGTVNTVSTVFTTSSTVLNSGGGCLMQAATASAYIGWSAEL